MVHCLFEKCLYNLVNNPGFAADQAKFEELDTLVNTMKRLHVKPGDWHAGLTMLQSTMNTFWDGFLQPLVKRLGWKRVRQDCRDCYFQASRYVRYGYHELIKILMEQYVGKTSLTFESILNQQTSTQVMPTFTVTSREDSDGGSGNYTHQRIGGCVLAHFSYACQKIFLRSYDLTALVILSV